MLVNDGKDQPRSTNHEREKRRVPGDTDVLYSLLARLHHAIWDVAGLRQLVDPKRETLEYDK